MGLADGEQFSVLDLRSRTVKTYIADKIFTNTGEMLDRVDHVNTSSQGQATLNQFRSAMSLIEGNLYSIPEDLPNTSHIDFLVNASMLITHPQTKNQIANYLQDSVQWTQALEIIGAGIVNSLGIVQMKADVRVVFF